MTQPFVRPDVQAFLDGLAANPMPAMSEAMIAMARQGPPADYQSADLPVGELAVVRDLAMPGPAGSIPLRLFDARKRREPSPVVVFYHGGGFVLGGLESHAGVCAEIARQLDLPVVSVDYRLAPEHKWPAGPDDAEAAARWIAENGADFGRSATHLILCGDSAGGNFALVTTLALRDRPAAVPVLMQLALYPTADWSRTYPSFEDLSHGFSLEGEGIEFVKRAYAPDVNHWRASPVLGDQVGLPPTCIVTAALDPLRDEGRAYAAHAIEAGVPVTYREMPGQIHGFASFRRVLPSGKADFDHVLALARAILAETAA